MQPPSFFAHANPCLITVEILCPGQVPDCPALKIFETSMGICNEIGDAALGQGETVLSQVVLDAVVWQHLSHIQIDNVGFCGVAILNFSGDVSRKGRYQTMSLVILVDICTILGNVPLNNDLEDLASLVADLAIPERYVLRLHLYRNNLIGLVDWLKGGTPMASLATRWTL